MAAVTICSDFGAPQNKVCLFPSICHEVMGPVKEESENVGLKLNILKN